MTSVFAHLSQGLDIFNATTTSSLLRDRYAGSGVYTALNLNGTRLQELGDGFEGALSASGQLASRALLTSQECGYGGQEDTHRRAGTGVVPTEQVFTGS